MLTLPEMTVAAPTSLAEALDALQAPGTRILAGGTDLLPNLKHRIYGPEGDTSLSLVSLHNLDELRGIEEDDYAVRIGAMTTLNEIAHSEVVQAVWPSLAEAASLVASPQIRNVATLGGNLNLDTRCRYVNQTEFWRSAIGGCIKADGTVCHVVPGGKRCVAALSSDTVPVLVTLDATIELHSKTAQRNVAVLDYFKADGTRHRGLEPGELVTRICLPKPTRRGRSAYIKWRPRKAIDFPLVSVALRFDGNETIEDAKIAIGVLGARPKLVASERLVGRRFDDVELPADVGELVYGRARPLLNVPYEVEYRRRMLRVLTRRAMERLK